MSLFSVNTNIGALAALQSLDQTQEALDRAQNEISTGQKVATAADNPAIYSIANTINSNIAGLSAVSDSLNFGAQVVATASSAVTNINNVLQSLQQTVTSSNTSGENLTTLQAQINAELTSIDQYAASANFSGVNLLTPTAAAGGTNQLNVVQSVDGSVYNVKNQVTQVGGANSTSLTEALGISGLNVDVGSGNSTIGANIAFGTGTTVGSTATPGTFVAAAGSNAAIQLSLGKGSDGNTQTITFEFVDTGAATPQQLQTNPTADNTTLAVDFNSTKDSTNQIVASLAAVLSANGFGVVQQSDGSLNIVGNGLTNISYGTATTGVYTEGAGDDAVANGTTGTTASSGVLVTSLSNSTANETTVLNAVNNLNTIAANLGAASQQITGIQNFTTALSSALTAGVGALTDADLAAESAQLTSLQTKQQLATQSLSIANQAPQNLLTLFKNA